MRRNRRRVEVKNSIKIQEMRLLKNRTSSNRLIKLNRQSQKMKRNKIKREVKTKKTFFLMIKSQSTLGTRKFKIKKISRNKMKKIS